jgi:hypothetical protein
MTMITIEELRRLAAAGTVTLPPQKDPEGTHTFEALTAPAGSDPAGRVSDLLKTVRDLTKSRSPEQTAELERWLEERDA